MVPYAKVSSSRFQVDLQQSHFSILNSTSSRLRQVKPTPLDLRSSSRPKSTYWGRLPGLITGEENSQLSTNSTYLSYIESSLFQFSTLSFEFRSLNSNTSLILSKNFML